jgi:hypothetical protein
VAVSRAGTGFRPAHGKWPGSAFAALDTSDGLDLGGDLGAAFEAIARRFNATGMTEPVESTLRRCSTASRSSRRAWRP